MKKRIAWNKGIKNSEETRRKMSIVRKGIEPWNKGKIGFQSHSIETRIKIGKSESGDKNYGWKGGSIEIVCKECGAKKFHRPVQIKKGWGKFCSTVCAKTYLFKHQRKEGTNIERLIEQELIKRNISYDKQVPIPEAHTFPDFVLNNKIVIYCDGDYWHCNPKRKSQDFKQTKALEELGYKVFRFLGSDILRSSAICIDKIF